MNGFNGGGNRDLDKKLKRTKAGARDGIENEAWFYSEGESK